MNSKKKRRGQMSEAFCTAMFLSLSGGLQDVYTYLFRGKVFANAQTGNIVLMAVHAFAGEWGRVLHYLVPLCFFALGVFAAELMHQKLQNLQRLHWWAFSRRSGTLWPTRWSRLPVRCRCRPSAR